MKTSLFSILLSLSSSLVWGTPVKRTVSMAGGTAHIPVMQDAAKLLTAEGIELVVAAGGSGVGITKVATGLVDIGNSGRPLTPEEKTRYGLEEHRFAIDGIALIVHPGNPLQNVDAATAQRIFSGIKTQWSDFTSRQGAIRLYTREESSGTRQTFKELVMKESPFAVYAHVVTSNGAMKVAVAQDLDAIGFCSIGHLDRSVKAVAFSGIAPTQSNAASGIYPVVRPLVMAVRKNPSAPVLRVLQLIQSPAFADHIRAYGYLPLSAP